MLLRVFPHSPYPDYTVLPQTATGNRRKRDHHMAFQPEQLQEVKSIFDKVKQAKEARLSISSGSGRDQLSSHALNRSPDSRDRELKYVKQMESTRESLAISPTSKVEGDNQVVSIQTMVAVYAGLANKRSQDSNGLNQEKDELEILDKSLAGSPDYASFQSLVEKASMVAEDTEAKTMEENKIEIRDILANNSARYEVAETESLEKLADSDINAEQGTCISTSLQGEHRQLFLGPAE